MGKFLEVLLAECLQLARAPVGEAQAYHALVFRVWAAGYQSGGLGAIDESDGAVVTQQQVLGDVADRWSARVCVAADGEQELMLRWSQARGLGLPFAPAQEAAQSCAED